MNKLMIGLAVGLGTFAIAEASKAIDAKKAKAKAEAKANAKQRAKQVVEQRAAAAKKMADIESQRLKERCAKMDRDVEQHRLRKSLEQHSLKHKARLKALEDKYFGRDKYIVS